MQKKTKLSEKEINHIFSNAPSAEINNFIKLLSALQLPAPAQPVEKIKNSLVVKTKKRVVRRKKLIVPSIIKSPEMRISKLAKKAKSKK